MRCRNCEKPIQVLDLCEICEMGPASILPEEMMLCELGHAMTRGHHGWLCGICRRMRQIKYKAELRRVLRMQAVDQ